MKRVIFWFRRDLRLTDNRGLHEACKAAEEVIPVYILSIWRGSHRWSGPPRQKFLCGSLESLAKNLDAIGGRLIFQEGPADEVFEELLEKTKAEAIYYNRDPDPHGRLIEKLVKNVAQKRGVSVLEFKDIAIHERDEIVTLKGEPFRVFTAYSKAWAKAPKTPPLPGLDQMKTPAVRSIEPPTMERWGLHCDAAILQCGERAARTRMDYFLDGPIFKYGTLRDIPSEEATSRLSQDLRFGLISIRELYHRCIEHIRVAKADERKSIQTFVNELIWREFYFQILWHFPEVLELEFNSTYRNLPWWDPKQNNTFERWTEGLTGFPIVDAAMRQLEATGFMHNRLRMVTAMFLTKDLHLDWRLGEMHFMQKLVDGDIASNNGGWQWSAGTGADAAPYFRVQNPWLQSKRFDPDGRFIKHWLPELRDVPVAQLHKPATGLRIAKDYPSPIVDHKKEREVAIDMFKTAANRKPTYEI